jgi:hypothetical protein
VKFTFVRIDSEKSTPDKLAPEKFIPVRFRFEKSKPARFFFEQLPLALSVQPFAFAAFSAEITIALSFFVVAVAVSFAETGPAKDTIKPKTAEVITETRVMRFIFTPNKLVYKCLLAFMDVILDCSPKFANPLMRLLSTLTSH